MKTLLLIDANALVHRSFHALPPLTTPAGEPIGAVYGLASTLLKVFREEPPDYVAAAYDRPEPTFREELFKEYKAQRPKAPEELNWQIAKSKELLEKFGIKNFEQPGLEADDLIGALSEKFKKEPELRIVILTGDLDTLQLVEGEKVVVKTLKKGVSETVVYDEAAVKERFGVAPHQLTDYKGLIGDPSDNIPGVPGVGPKTASEIFKRYVSLEELYQELETPGVEERLSAKEKKLREKLLANKENALLAKKLVTIERTADIKVGLEELACRSSNVSELKTYFQELGFQSLLPRLETNFQTAAVLSKKPPAEWTIGFNLKETVKSGRKVKEPYFDLMVAAWLIDPDLKDYSPPTLARKFLRKELSDPEEIAPQLFALFNQKIKEYGLEKIFWEIEMPLIRVLAAMEKLGIKIDIKVLKGLNRELRTEIEQSKAKIYRQVGKKFNLNSPRQITEILKERFNLKVASTQAQKLEALRDENPVIGLILQYREDFKIKSTYVEPLLKLTGRDGRLHTTFNQTGTATGRLSSSEPNLQNIPQESCWAGKLRRAFVAEKGYQLAFFDYSQLELRILASVAGDEKLQQAFRQGLDIHALTAAQVLNRPLEKVTPAMRRLGKTLNFGVIYGMGATAFARQSGLEKEEAKKFIEEYFSDFPKVRVWQGEMIRQARTFGYVANLNGRRRWLFELNERVAVNMPIQSLGADIIKLAMIKTYHACRQAGEKARLLLSIHDELLFEIDDAKLKEQPTEIKEIMEDVYPLTVPLKIDWAVGQNWAELKK